MSADGELVCLHDPTTARTAPFDPPVDVRTVSYGELNDYDVGSWKAKEYESEKIPRLPEILVEMPESTMIYIEIKQDNPQIISRLMETITVSPVHLSQAILISFNPAVVRLAKELAPDLKAFLLYDPAGDKEKRAGGIPLDQLPQFTRFLGADGVDIGRHVQVDKALVTELRASRLEFHVWTVNTLDDALKYIDLGVDSITTDRPLGLRRELEAYFQSAR